MILSSFILSRQEWRYALSGEGDPGSLEDKGLATRDGNGSIVTCDALRLVAREYAAANPEEIAPGVTAMRGKRFCMLIEEYPLMEDALKITLLKDQAALEAEIGERWDAGDGQSAC